MYFQLWSHLCTDMLMCHTLLINLYSVNWNKDNLFCVNTLSNLILLIMIFFFTTVDQHHKGETGTYIVTIICEWYDIDITENKLSLSYIQGDKGNTSNVMIFMWRNELIESTVTLFSHLEYCTQSVYCQSSYNCMIE